MHYVYVLKSIYHPDKYYVGLTKNLKQRLKEHNEGHTIFGNKYRPWEIETYTAFRNKERACQFERYLKVGSGHAFLKRHLI